MDGFIRFYRGYSSRIKRMNTSNFGGHMNRLKQDISIGKNLKKYRKLAGLTQGEAAAQMEVMGLPVTADILAKMESEELITRACHDDDKRNINITLTENGRRITEEVTAKQAEAVKQMMLCLTSEELTTLENLMNKLLADWDYKFGEEAKLYGPPDRKRGQKQ